MLYKNSEGVDVAQRPQAIKFSEFFSVGTDGQGVVEIGSSFDDGVATLTNTTTDNTISVDQNGNVGTAVATDGAVHIENTGNTGIGLAVYTNIGAEGASELVSIKSDNAAFTQNVVQITNDGTGFALNISVVGAMATNKAALYILNNSVDQTVGYALAWFRDNRSGSSVKVVEIQNAGSGNTLSINNDGTGRGIFIDDDGAGNQASVDIDRDGNSASALAGLKITVDNAGAGAVIAIDVSGMSNDETVINLNTTLNTTLSTKSPETDAEAGWFAVRVGTTQYAVPIYALS